ncbi:hypothetical protein ASD58_10885 [Duganella sp. Root1480D1]|nr:hypothetical protein ASD58_10885 [Duganella sp. Root1480D1]
MVSEGAWSLSALFSSIAALAMRFGITAPLGSVNDAKGFIVESRELRWLHLRIKVHLKVKHLFWPLTFKRALSL